MSKNTKHKLYKSYLSLIEEESKNDEARRNLGYRELPKPIPYGFKAYFVLRNDIANRQDADLLAALVKRYTTVSWNKTEEFYRVYKRYIVDNNPTFTWINQKEYDELSEKVRKYFHFDYSKTKKMWNGNVINYYRFSIERHFLVIKIERDFKTHQKVIDGELERKANEIRRELWKIWNVFEPYDSNMKWFGTAQNRRDRRYNKIALRKNLNAQFIDNDEWVDWSSHSAWSHDPHEFTYKTRHGARWMRD